MENIVYHGSPYGDIKVITAHKSTHQKQCIYATSNKVVAMLFMARGNGDLDTCLMYENGLPILVERRNGVLEKLYNKSGYIYELPGDTFNHYDFLWKPEVISFEKEIIPLKKEYHENIFASLKEMEKNGLLKLYKYPNRPNDIPLDNSDLIDKYIRFENKGIKGAINSLLTIYPEFAQIVKNKLDNNLEKISSDEEVYSQKR